MLLFKSIILLVNVYRSERKKTPKRKLSHLIIIIKNCDMSLIKLLKYTKSIPLVDDLSEILKKFGGSMKKSGCNFELQMV